MIRVARRPRFDRRGFTLIELVMVIVVVGALAAVIAPIYRDRDEDSKVATMRGVVRTVRWRIQVYHSETGTYPATVDPSWFNAPLTNVFSSDANRDQIFVASAGSFIYPANKTFTSSSGFSMWYNTETGAFCVRVPPQVDNAASLTLFNRVNMTAVTSMSQRF